MKISLIIPTYKPAEYIYDCLRSVGGQTLDKGSFEVIVVLNGCNEPWHGQLKEFIASEMSSTCVSLVQTDCGGVSNARNIAMGKARGEYIAFLDDDDFISQRYLEALLEKATPGTVVLSDSLSFIDGTTDYDTTYRQHQVFQSCAETYNQNITHARSIFNGPCMKLIPRDFMQGETFDIRLANGEDSLFMFQISRKILKLDYAPEAIYYRRIRENSAVTRRKSLGYSVKLTTFILWKYVAAWMKHPFQYNMSFFITRLLAANKNFLIDVRNLVR